MRAGLRRPDAGRLRVLVLDPVADGERLRRLVGSQLQASGLPDRLRVGEPLYLFAGRQDDALLEKVTDLLSTNWTSLRL